MMPQGNEWCNAVYDEFVKLGAVRSTLENAMFMWYDGNDIIGHLCSHVDETSIMNGKKR